jgi:ammonia channel protein AmtB
MQNIDLLFLLLGAVLVLAMHAGFAFLELGTVRHKNQVNALSKILTDFSLSAIAYFFVGYYISYGHHFFHIGDTLAADHGYNLMRCFFLLTFAAAIPAIISGGIAERAKMRSQAIATVLLVALVYPFLKGSRGMATLVYSNGYKTLSAQVSMTSQVQWLYMLWEAGSLWLRWFYSVHVMDATRKMVVSVRILLHLFLSWL